VRAGAGGGGAVAFRREKGEPKGGPHGGDGGTGGSVVLKAEEGMGTLYDFRHQVEFFAQNGESGGKKQCHGADAPDLIIQLPPGTLVFNVETGDLMHDLKPGESIVIAKGGRGGFGNEHFKSSINQTPKTATPGAPGEGFNVRLELKLIAEVGLIGMPNAGKSTLLAATTRATPKIGNYPFTTLSPQLGIAEVDSTRRMVLADIPGLIEGASQGAGLGHEFLRHVERTKMLVHLLDAAPTDESRPAENYRTIRAELGHYSEALADKPELIVLNKVDLLTPEQRDAAINDLASELGVRADRDILAISGASHENLDVLLERLWALLHPKGDGASGWKATPQPVTGATGV